MDKFVSKCYSGRIHWPNDNPKQAWKKPAMLISPIQLLLDHEIQTKFMYANMLLWQNRNGTDNVTNYTCICTRSSVLILLDASLSLPSPRWPHNESISSMKMIEGAFSRAIWKRFETNFSLSPIHFETKSEEDMLQFSKYQFIKIWNEIQHVHITILCESVTVRAYINK